MGTLTVVQPTGHQFPLEFFVYDSILDIKERIRMQFGIPVPNQVLSFPGVGAVADDVNVLTACLSLGGFHIHLTINIQLVVHISDTGDRLPLQYDVAAPLGPLKQMISIARDVPADQLRLFIGNVSIHDDNGTLAGYGVNGPSVALDVFVGDELIILNRRDQTHFKLRQVLTESVLALKTKIETMVPGTAADRLALYNGNQELLDSTMALASYGVADGWVLEMGIKIQLTIDLPPDAVNSLDDSIFSLLHDDTEPVRSLKERIWERAGIPTDHLFLFMGMHEIEDDRALSCYKAREGSVVTAMIQRGPGHRIKLTVRIVDGGRQYSMDQDVTLPISRLRKRIGDAVGIRTDVLTLSLSNGTKLQDISTLADYRVPDGSVVDVNTGMDVRVKSMCGTKTITVYVRATDRISELRTELRKAEEHQGFPLPKKYFFIHGENVVYDENTTFLHEGIEHRDIVEVFRGFITEKD